MVNHKIEIKTDNTSTYSQNTTAGIDSTENKKSPHFIKLVDNDTIPSPKDELIKDNQELVEKLLIESTPKKESFKDIISKNLEQAINKIFEYAENTPEDSIIQKYASKLKEIINNKKLILTDIPDKNVAGKALKNDDNTDTILIDNHDSFNNFNVNNLLKTLLHELRHTMETDNLNSKAEEIEAELSANELAAKITGTPPQEIDISEWINAGYNIYAEASPGTYDIPQNTGFSVWYKPEEVKMDEQENLLLIKSQPQEKMDGAVIEDYVEFGNQTDENGNRFPVSAKRIIKDKSGQIIANFDYGKYDYKKREFSNNAQIYLAQKKLEHKNIKITGLM